MIGKPKFMNQRRAKDMGFIQGQIPGPGRDSRPEPGQERLVEGRAPERPEGIHIGGGEPRKEGVIGTEGPVHTYRILILVVAFRRRSNEVLDLTRAWNVGKRHILQESLGHTVETAR